MGQSILDTLTSLLEQTPTENLFAIVDGAQDLELAYEAKVFANSELMSLFEGESADGMAEVAPYFFQINRESDYLQNWVRRWGSNAGILLTSPLDADTLHRHLRTIFVVKNEEGQEFFFRYYDPRVIRTYLPTCKPEEAVPFFGGITSFIVEEEEPSAILRYVFSENGVEVEKRTVAETTNSVK